VTSFVLYNIQPFALHIRDFSSYVAYFPTEYGRSSTHVPFELLQILRVQGVFNGFGDKSNDGINQFDANWLIDTIASRT